VGRTVLPGYIVLIDGVATAPGHVAHGGGGDRRRPHFPQALEVGAGDRGIRVINAKCLGAHAVQGCLVVGSRIPELEEVQHPIANGPQGAARAAKPPVGVNIGVVVLMHRHEGMAGADDLSPQKHAVGQRVNRLGAVIGGLKPAALGLRHGCDADRVVFA